MIEEKAPETFPGLDVLLYLNVAGMLASALTSGSRRSSCSGVHGQLLAQCPVRCLQEAVGDLLVRCVLLDHVSLSQRFNPS